MVKPSSAREVFEWAVSKMVRWWLDSWKWVAGESW